MTSTSTSTDQQLRRQQQEEHLQPTAVLAKISDSSTAFSHIPEQGFSLFLASRTKTIHFIRHAEGTHNAANAKAGDDTPVTFDTPNAWLYQDAKLTNKGIQQCLAARSDLLVGISPELVVVSPFTRTLQTAHVMFGGKNLPFIVHDTCGERRGKFTCDKRRSKTEIIKEMAPIYAYTGDGGDSIDFTSFAYETENDEIWTEERESDESVTQRGIAMMQWLATRPERDIAVVTHSSWLRHLFQAFGTQIVEKDQTKLHRVSGNAEVRSITLAMHKGFYPKGSWETRKNGHEVFVPEHHSFRRGRWAPSDTTIAEMHQRLGDAEHGSNKKELKEHESMPY